MKTSENPALNRAETKEIKTKQGLMARIGKLRLGIAAAVLAALMGISGKAKAGDDVSFEKLNPAGITYVDPSVNLASLSQRIDENNILTSFNTRRHTRSETMEIQRILILRGHNLGNYGENDDGVDGVYGRLTRAALRVEQEKIKAEEEFYRIRDEMKSEASDIIEYDGTRQRNSNDLIDSVTPPCPTDIPPHGGRARFRQNDTAPNAGNTDNNNPLFISGGARASNRGGSGELQVGNRNFNAQVSIGENAQAGSLTVGGTLDNGVEVKATVVGRTERIDGNYRNGRVNQVGGGIEVGKVVTQTESGTGVYIGAYAGVTHSGNKVLSDRTITQQVVNGNITTTTTTRQRDNFEGQTNVYGGGKVELRGDDYTAYVAAGPTFNRNGVGVNAQVGVEKVFTENTSGYANYGVIAPKGERSTQYAEAGIRHQVRENVAFQVGGFYGKGAQEEFGGVAMLSFTWGGPTRASNQNIRMPANAGETIRAKPLRPVPMTNLGYRVTSGEVRRSSRTNVKVETVIPADIFSEFDFFSQYGPTFNYTFSNLPAGVTIKNVINAEVGNPAGSLTSVSASVTSPNSIKIEANWSSSDIYSTGRGVIQLELSNGGKLVFTAKNLSGS